jgi:hypothetical protein
MPILYQLPPKKEALAYHILTFCPANQFLTPSKEQSLPFLICLLNAKSEIQDLSIIGS